MKVGGYIETSEKLAGELCSPKAAPQVWKLNSEVPYKYRALFPFIIKTTCKILGFTTAKGFYFTYISYSLIFFYLVLCFFYVYLETLGFTQKESLIGCVLFLLSPPVLLAYLTPTHTREDPLAYLLIILGMIAVLKSRFSLVTFFGIVAALCRETTLIAPLTFLITAKDKIVFRVIPLFFSVVTLVILRSAMGYKSYSALAWGGGENILYPFESFVAVFLIFGVFWFIGFKKWVDMKKISNMENNWRILIISFPVVFLLTFSSHLFLAKIRELRISFILFPWIIPFALKWFLENKLEIKRALQNFRLKIIAIILFGVFLVFFFYEKTFQPLFFTFHNRFWFFVLYLHVILSIAYFSILKSNKNNDSLPVMPEVSSRG